MRDGGGGRSCSQLIPLDSPTTTLDPVAGGLDGRTVVDRLISSPDGDPLPRRDPDATNDLPPRGTPRSCYQAITSRHGREHLFLNYVLSSSALCLSLTLQPCRITHLSKLIIDKKSGKSVRDSQPAAATTTAAFRRRLRTVAVLGVLA